MWTCPKCSAEVEPTFDVCWQCGTTRDGVEDPTFVTADDAGPLGDPLEDTEGGAGVSGAAIAATEGLVACYQALTLQEARFLAEQLESEGIRAVSDTHDMQDALGGWSGNPRVYVRAEDQERARDWLAAYDARRKKELEEDPEARLEG